MTYGVGFGREPFGYAPFDYAPPGEADVYDVGMRNRDLAPLYLAEVTACTDASGATTTLRYSSGSFATEPTDTPADTLYLPRLSGSVRVVRTMFNGSRTYGASRVGMGVLTLVNQDGALDGLLPYSFDNRPITVRAGQVGARYNEFITAARGTCQQVAFTNATVTLTLRDRMPELLLPHLTSTYGGTGGLDGDSSLANKVKPRTYGVALNVPPAPVNTSLWIYQASDGAVASIDNVWEGGVPLTRGADYADLNELLSVQPAAGTYRCYLAGGYFRLNTAAKEITADVSQAAAAGCSTAQVLQAMALNAGIASADIASADVSALDFWAPWRTGIYVSSPESTQSLMDQIAASVGAYYGFDRTGTLRMAQLQTPLGVPVVSLSTRSMSSLDRLPAPDGLPTWRVTLQYARYWQRQTSGLDNATGDRRAQVANTFRTVKVEDATVPTQWLAAQTMQRETLLVDAGPAAFEAGRILAIYKRQRHLYKANGVKLTQAVLAALELNAVVWVTWPRFGLTTGKLMRVVGLDADYVTNMADLTLWM